MSFYRILYRYPGATERERENNMTKKNRWHAPNMTNLNMLFRTHYIVELLIWKKVFNKKKKNKTIEYIHDF